MTTKRHTFLIIGAIAALPFGTSARPAAAQESGGTIRLAVSSFRNTEGTLNCRLFAEPRSFPDGEGVRTVRTTIGGTEAGCTFDNVPPGTYAVAVVHDENANGRLDKNFFGIPKEGYGVSKNRTYALSSPKWRESKFTVAAKETVTMRVRLRY